MLFHTSTIQLLKKHDVKSTALDSQFTVLPLSYRNTQSKDTSMSPNNILNANNESCFNCRNSKLPKRSL